ncbi:MAG: Uncharacterized protein JWO89_1844 [Verrucomicrobiaceae bacterium]|nr:Uncharacterized protein [Verrucomicrobiaceae bacterium]
MTMQPKQIDHTQIKGWGVDADPKNDPTYPMKRRNNGEHQGYTWERPSQQPPQVEVLHSNERPNLSAVYGTSTPPMGLSGMLRREAFKFSESSYGHWLPLMLADRIGVVEGIVDDLGHGHVPNFFEERGWNAEWKYNRKAFVAKLALGLLVASWVLASTNRRR